MSDIPFVGFPKISRLNRKVVVTEKIDGTNAQVFIDDTGTGIIAGSRTRWIKPGDDNYGFAAWVEHNKQELLKLGPGQHFGEWWGAGIQRRYGLTEKRFSPFNSLRWEAARLLGSLPACCHVVPIIWAGNMEDFWAADVIEQMVAKGSTAAPGFMDPEGIVVYHQASNTMYKKTCKADEKPKGSAE